MTRVRAFARILCSILLALAAMGAPLHAQEPTGGASPLRVTVLGTTGALSLGLGRLFDDAELTAALDRGLPVRFTVKAELWRDRFFDSQEGSAEWRASVRRDAVTRRYVVEWSGGGSAQVSGPGAVDALLGEVFSLALRPSRPGRFYYVVVGEVETLSVSDLEELRRWLGGDLGAAVRGEGGVDGAVTRGVRRVLVRALGVPTRRIQLRTDTFDFGG